MMKPYVTAIPEDFNSSSGYSGSSRHSLSSRGSSRNGSRNNSGVIPRILGTPCRTALSRDSFESGDRIIWGNVRPDGFNPNKDSGFKPTFSKDKVLNPSNSNYGYGSVIISTINQTIHEMGHFGGDVLNKDLYNEALQEYDKKICDRPNDVNRRILRADALVQSHRFEEALREYHVAQQLDPTNVILHHRLSIFHIRVGVFDIAEQHMTRACPECKKDLHAKIEKVKGRLIRGGSARKDDNWKVALEEVDGIISEGIDYSKSIFAFKAEMLLKLDQLDQAKETISKAFALESTLPRSIKFLGMSPEAYVFAVHAQIQMALGRFEDASEAADRAQMRDRFNEEVYAIRTNVRMTAVARIRGNNHYKKGEYLEACGQYEIGLKYAKSNITLLNNLAACHWQLERWESCIKICNQVLWIHPANTKALIRRAASFAKLQKWAECVSNYETAVKVFPGDATIAKALLNAQVALEDTQVDNVLHILNEPEIKEITTAEQFRDAISTAGTSIIFFYYPAHHRCIEISSYLDDLSTSDPSLNLRKVDISECPEIAEAENMHQASSVVMYRKGCKMTEIVNPTKEEIVSWLELYI